MVKTCFSGLLMSFSIKSCTWRLLSGQEWKFSGHVTQVQLKEGCKNRRDAEKRRWYEAGTVRVTVWNLVLGLGWCDKLFIGSWYHFQQRAGRREVKRALYGGCSLLSQPGNTPLSKEGDPGGHVCIEKGGSFLCAIGSPTYLCIRITWGYLINSGAQAMPHTT